MKSVITTAIVTLATLASASAHASKYCAIHSKDQNGAYSGGVSIEVKVNEPKILQQDGASLVTASLSESGLNLAAFNVETKEVKAMAATTSDAKFLALFLPDSQKMVVCIDSGK